MPNTNNQYWDDLTTIEQKQVLNFVFPELAQNHSSAVGVTLTTINAIEVQTSNKLMFWVNKLKEVTKSKYN